MFKKFKLLIPPSLSGNYIALLVLLGFGIIFCLESLVNHYLFRTYSLDLGAYTQAMYRYSRFSFDYSTLMLGSNNNNILAGHFSLYPLLISPFRFVFGSYTLLIFQIVAMLWGGWGIYTYFRWKSNLTWFPLLAMIHFFCIWSIYAALSYDYHDNVVAAMFVPWLVYHFKKKNWKTFIVFLLLILISKENMALWAIFISIGLMLLRRNSKEHLMAAGVSTVLALVYFVTVVKWVMPSLDITGADQISQLQRYSSLGKTWSEFFYTFFTRPGYVFSLLFDNTNNGQAFDHVKVELHYMVLAAGGWALLFRPAYLIMLIPIYAQKMFSTDSSFWGTDGQYSIEFVPVLSLATFSLLHSINKSRIRITLVITSILLAATATFLKMTNKKWGWSETNNVCFFQKNHYRRDLDVSKAYQLLDMIPKESPVSAHSVFIPHLVLRDKVYCFPDIRDAGYVLLPINSIVTWPFSREYYDSVLNKLILSKEWIVLHKQIDLILLKKIGNQ
jgi:uncharacterized membrane protein